MPGKSFSEFCINHNSDIVRLVRTFGGYEPITVDKGHFLSWMEQFNQRHLNLALKLAKNLHYFDVRCVTALMRPLHQMIIRQVEAEKSKLGSAIFVPLGGTGESGADILRRYRNVNRLHKRKDQFLGSVVELPMQLHATDNPIVFFIEDFIGTGDKIAKYWETSLSEVVPEYFPLYLGVLAACHEGVERVEANSPLKVLSVYTIKKRRDQLTDPTNTSFSDVEKAAIRQYCDYAGNHPLGYGDLGLLVSFFYDTPNNTISVIRGSRGQARWRGLLPRWEDLDK